MITFDYSKSYRKAKLICDDKMIFNFIRNHFSIVNETAKFANKKLKAKGIRRLVPERKYLIGESGLFYLGMWKQVSQFLISEQLTDVVFTSDFEKAIDVPNVDITAIDGLEMPLREYQAEVVSKCLQMGSGTIVIGTGGGKSYVQASLLENWQNQIKKDFSCIIIVPGTSLVDQLLDDFENYGVTFSFSGWTGSKPLEKTSVVIVNTELFHNQFSDNGWILDVDLVLTDEAHKARENNVLTKLINKIPTVHKFGFTGTLPKEQDDVWKIIGTFGEVIYEKSSKELRDEKYLSNVRVNVLNLIHDRKPFKFYTDELGYLHNCNKRNSLICKLGEKLTNNVLIMVNRIEHGENILEMFKDINTKKNVVFIQGEVEVEKRKEFIQYMETHDDAVCIAMSAIFSTGINVKNIHHIIFTDGGKAFIRTIQSVGRGLRLHEKKNRLEIFDLCDNMKYSERHIEHRKQFYDDEKIDWNERKIQI